MSASEAETGEKAAEARLERDQGQEAARHPAPEPGEEPGGDGQSDRDIGQGPRQEE